MPLTMMFPILLAYLDLIEAFLHLGLMKLSYIFYLFYFTCIFSLHHDNLHNYFSTTFYIA